MSILIVLGKIWLWFSLITFILSVWTLYSTNTFEFANFSAVIILSLFWPLLWYLEIENHREIRGRKKDTVTVKYGVGKDSYSVTYGTKPRAKYPEVRHQFEAIATKYRIKPEILEAHQKSTSKEKR